MTSNYVLHYAFQFVCQITVLKSKLTCNTFLVLTSFFSLRFQDGEHRCFTDCELSQRQKKRKVNLSTLFIWLHSLSSPGVRSLWRPHLAMVMRQDGNYAAVKQEFKSTSTSGLIYSILSRETFFSQLPVHFDTSTRSEVLPRRQTLQETTVCSNPKLNPILTMPGEDGSYHQVPVGTKSFTGR